MILALLLAAATPENRTAASAGTARRGTEATAAMIFSVFFWVLVALFLGSIVAGYMVT
ncbi:MAG: hypothetical protein ACMUIL_12545 [bacterium]